MAADPVFAATVNNNGGLLLGAETNLNVPTATYTFFTAGASGSKIEEIVVEAAGPSLVQATVPGLVYIFLHDGTAYHLYDVLPVTASTPSATVPPFRLVKTYANFVIESGWQVRCSQSIAGNATTVLKLHIFGGDF